MMRKQRPTNVVGCFFDSCMRLLGILAFIFFTFAFSQYSSTIVYEKINFVLKLCVSVAFDRIFRFTFRNGGFELEGNKLNQVPEDLRFFIKSGTCVEFLNFELKLGKHLKEESG